MNAQTMNTAAKKIYTILAQISVIYGSRWISFYSTHADTSYLLNTYPVQVEEDVCQINMQVFHTKCS